LNDYDPDAPFSSPIYLIKTKEHKYKFFTLGDRGAIEHVIQFDRLEDAVRRKVEYQLCDFGQEASDAIYSFCL
jgi:hypothetical protein